MGLSYGYGPAADTQEMITLIGAAVERGIPFVDTSEVYGPYSNEDLVGAALAPCRGPVVIATKFGCKLGPNGEQLGLDSQPAHSKEVAEATLQRLRGKLSTCSINTGWTRWSPSKPWRTRCAI